MHLLNRMAIKLESEHLGEVEGPARYKCDREDMVHYKVRKIQLHITHYLYALMLPFRILL